MAPSSPENHIPYLLPHHHHHHHRHHHHHKRHHHHEGHLNRPKISNSLRRETQNYDHIMTSLDEILKALDINRKENGKKIFLYFNLGSRRICRGIQKTCVRFLFGVANSTGIEGLCYKSSAKRM